MQVEVDEPEALAGRLRAGHRADADGAVAAQHHGRPPGAERRLDPLGHLARGLRDAVGVLGPAVLAIGSPAAQRDVAEVVEPRAEARLTQRPRRLLLAGGEGAQARGRADECVRHDRRPLYGATWCADELRLGGEAKFRGAADFGRKATITRPRPRHGRPARPKPSPPYPAVVDVRSRSATPSRTKRPTGRGPPRGRRPRVSRAGQQGHDGHRQRGHDVQRHGHRRAGPREQGGRDDRRQRAAEEARQLVAQRRAAVAHARAEQLGEERRLRPVHRRVERAGRRHRGHDADHQRPVSSSGKNGNAHAGQPSAPAT